MSQHPYAPKHTSIPTLDDITVLRYAASRTRTRASLDAQVKFRGSRRTRGFLWRLTRVHPTSFEDPAFEVGHCFDHKPWLPRFVIEQAPDSKSLVPENLGDCSTSHRQSGGVMSGNRSMCRLCEVARGVAHAAHCFTQSQHTRSAPEFCRRVHAEAFQSGKHT